MLHLGKRVHPTPPAAADLTDDPAGPDGGARGGAEVRRRSGLDRLTRGHRQVHTGRNTEGRFIRHAGALALPILALAVAMVRTPFGGLLMAAVSLAALEAKGFLTATRAAIQAKTTCGDDTDPLFDFRSPSSPYRRCKQPGSSLYLREPILPNRAVPE